MEQFDHLSGRSLAIDGADIYAEMHGDEDAPVLVFLHGGLGSMQDFNELIGHMRGRFRIVGIDARGHGRSTLGSAALTYARLQKDVEQVLDRLGLTSVDLIGFSDGGIVGFRLASDTPRRVRKLIAIGASNELRPDTVDVLRRVTPESWNRRFPETQAQYRRLNPAPDFDALVTGAVRMWLDESDDGYPRSAVERILAPTLIVRGDEDFLFTLDEAVEQCKLMPNACLLNVPLAGHAVCSDQPKVCAEVVSQFLEE